MILSDLNHLHNKIQPSSNPQVATIEKPKTLLTQSEKEGLTKSKLKYHLDNIQHDSLNSTKDYLQRFFLVTILLVPLVILSKHGMKILGIPDFSLRPYLEFGIATCIFYFALIFFKHALHEIKSSQYGMMTLVSLAVGAGYLFSAASTFITALKTEFYLEISTLIWVLLFGHFLETRSRVAARSALLEVSQLLPKQAHLIEDGKITDLEIESLQKGDHVLVRPGEKVPADGLIIKGEAHFNEAHITGESLPVRKSKGEKIIAGSVCTDGSIEAQLDQVGENSTTGQIQKLISLAQQSKPKTQFLADKAAKVLTFIALTVSIFTLITWSLLIGQTFVVALTLAIGVLVIACPHALGLAIPTVSTIATSMAVKNGVFIKDLGKIETIKDTNYVVFDKTGTLTTGKLGISDIISLTEPDNKNFNKLNDQQQNLIQIAASLEAHSTHVIARTIVDFAIARQIPLKEIGTINQIAGKGIKGSIKNKTYFIGNNLLVKEKKIKDKQAARIYDQLSKEGKTVIYIANSRNILGIIALADEIKQESSQAINKLYDLGIKTAMLTGDNYLVAQGVARKLQIITFFSQVLPQKKFEYVKKLQDIGNIVMMVGDGVNDAPALTQADVGVAIGARTDVAVEAGDVVLTRNNPMDIYRLILLSKKVYRKMKENLIWAIGYNVLAIPAAAGLFIPFGFKLTPSIGALLMSLSSVIVVINALTLRKNKLQV